MALGLAASVVRSFARFAQRSSSWGIAPGASLRVMINVGGVYIDRYETTNAGFGALRDLWFIDKARLTDRTSDHRQPLVSCRAPPG